MAQAENTGQEKQTAQAEHTGQDEQTAQTANDTADRNSRMKKIILPAGKDTIAELKAGDSLLISGVIMTARDCAHKRLKELIDAGEALPFDLKDAFIYYAGPCPAKPGMASGSCGPTTSARMESYAPPRLDLGLGGMIGKGEMSEEVRQAVARNKCV